MALDVIAGLTPKTPDEAYISGGFCFGFYAPAGFGKTTLAGSIAKSKRVNKVAWIDCKGAAYVLAGQNLPISIYEPPNFLKLDALNTGFLRQPTMFDTYVFDHVTHMQQMHLDSMSSPNNREWKHYTRSADWIKNKLVIPWLDNAKALGINVIFIFQTEVDKDEEGKRFIHRFNLTPHLAGDLPYLFDYIGYLQLVKEGSEERVLSFAPSPKFATKTRRPLVGPGADIPKVIYHPDLSAILDSLKGDKWPTHFNKPQTAGAVKAEESTPDENQEKESEGD